MGSVTPFRPRRKKKSAAGAYVTVMGVEVLLVPDLLEVWKTANFRSVLLPPWRPADGSPVIARTAVYSAATTIDDDLRDMTMRLAAEAMVERGAFVLLTEHGPQRDALKALVTGTPTKPGDA